ncbi:MAG TPA: group 1 truncated hemoglobin [Casimicrobiaceae bacterium]|nr:group 1 truncated hemoglobin [Casimicrobiaceae bacterium]
MRPLELWKRLLLAVTMLALGACASTTTETAAPADSLYRRLGGREGIAGVVDGFVANALADPRIGPAFKSLPAERVGPLKTNIADFICENTGGPCSYGGRTMKEAHKGLRLTRDDFDACNAALVKALDSAKVAPADKEQVMKLVQSLMPDIVGQ